MSKTESQSGTGGGTKCEFPPTHWSMVVRAAETATPDAQNALNELCRIYWFPIYAFIRIRERDRHQARDLTQGFFLYLMERQIIKRVDRTNGRFRSFLLACLQNYLTSEWRKEQAQRRGGLATIFSIDEDAAEEKYGQLPANEIDPALKFDRAWAVTVVEHVTASLKRTYEQRGRLEVYEALSPCLNAELPADSHSAVAEKLGMTIESLRVNLHRFREAFGDCIRSEISRIVVSPQEVNEEIRHLMSAWAGHLMDSQKKP